MGRPTRTHDRRSSGFTVIEMMIAITLAGFAFAAVASVMISSLKALSVQKSRTQGNEFATRGIEDLQRLDFDRLAFCTTAVGGSDPSPAFIPDTLKDSSGTPLQTVTATGSCNGSTVYADPCNPAASTLSAIPVPRQVYTCTRNNIVYKVNRYIVWADTAKTNKRLAVFVDWNDAVGGHRVAQQSSLRIPNPASLYGGPPPQFLSATATGGGTGCTNTALTCVNTDASGTPTATLQIFASTSGLTGSDAVTVNLRSVVTANGSDTAVATAIPLATSDNGATWTVTLNDSSGYRFQPGDQVLYVSAARASDGKVNSRFITDKPVEFCSPAGCGAGGPSFGPVSGPSTTVNIDSNGVLQGTATFKAQVSNVSSTDTVSISLQTVKGAVLLPLTNTSNGCSGTCTNWQIDLTAASGYRFNSGSQQVYFMATKQPTTTSLGSSAISPTTPTVTFE